MLKRTKKTGLSAMLSSGTLVFAYVFGIAARALIVWLAAIALMRPWTAVRVDYWWALGAVVLLGELREVFSREKK